MEEGMGVLTAFPLTSNSTYLFTKFHESPSANF